MKRVEKFCLFMMVVIFATFPIIGKESQNLEKAVQVKVGNFAVPGEQQVRPLIAFGQSVVDQGIAQWFVGVIQRKGPQQNFIEVTPMYLIYGITDRFSLLLNLNIATHFESEGAVSHGLEDFIIEFEYIPYIYETTKTVSALSLVADFIVPTGSADEIPATGYGASTFFLGFTANYLSANWYCFTSSGAILPTSYDNNKSGNTFLYQFGVSRNIWYKTDGWIFNWMIELDGTYRQRDKVCGCIDPNSGGNSILLGPSLWFSSRRFIAQAGISGFIAQHLFGTQPKDSYYAAAYVGWTFKF
jgi:hypothetical protein